MKNTSTRLRYNRIGFFVVFVLLPVYMQSQTAFRLGAHAGYLRSFHETIQNVRSGENECGAFTYATGGGPEFGLIGEILPAPWLRGSIRLSFARLGATFTTLCDNGIIVPTGEENTFEPLIREYTKNNVLDYGLLELGFRFLPFGFPLYVSAGFSVGAPIFASAWTQEERIVSPEGALFPDYAKSRSNGSDDFSDTRLRSAVAGGLGYIIQLPGEVELSPEVLLRYPLSDATTGYDWRISTVSAGISLSWRIELRKETTEAPQPLTPPLPSPPIAGVTAGTDAAVNITETFVTETFPLLPYIFFERDSDILSQKYAFGKRTGFSESTLPRKTLDIYYRLLDIVGNRMLLDKNIRVTLTGSTDDKDVEKRNSTLALRRAASVREYLVSVWHIDSNRITLATRSLPSIPSTLLFAEGDEENRRVEIISDSDALFQPIVHERLSEFEITPPTMDIFLTASGASSPAHWSMVIRHDDDTISEFSGVGAPPSSLQWRLDDSVAARMSAQDSISVTLVLMDHRGLSGENRIEIPVTKQQNSFEIGRLSLIVFDFDRSDILPHNQRMIRRFVAEAVKPSSSVVITGSTDRLGEESHNRTLSEARAENVRRILLSQNSEYKKLDARGIGEAPYLYDNDLPEGRFYCRTVAVEVSTPLE